MKKIAPYPPSWVNRFTTWIRGLATPAWVSYLVLFLLMGSLGVLSRMIAGLLPAGQWPTYTYYDVLGGSIFSVAILAYYHFYERDLSEALDHYLQFINNSREELEKTKYIFINLPAILVLIASIIFALSTFPAILAEYGLTRLSLSHSLLFVEWGITAAVTFGFIFRLIRLVFQIRRFFTDLTGLNLYNLGSIYELPSVAARGGLLFLILWYANLPFVLNEFVINNPLVLFITVAVSFVPFAAFVIPFSSLNRRLVREKNDEINRVSLKIKSAFEKMEDDFDSGKLQKMGNMESAISNLLSKRQFLEGIPTWPWRQGTFRLTITAVLLPIFVWLIQQLLDRALAL